MKFFQLITFLLTFALIEASGRKPRKYSKLDTAMQACNVYIGKYGTVCASSGKSRSIGSVTVIKTLVLEQYPIV